MPALIALGIVALNRGKSRAFCAMLRGVILIATHRTDARPTEIGVACVDVKTHVAAAVAVIAVVEVVTTRADEGVFGIAESGELLVADVIALDPGIGALVIVGVGALEILVD